MMSTVCFVMLLMSVFICACSTVCMAVDTCGQGWTTVDVCVAMFLDESTEVRDNSACVTKDVRFQNSLTRQVSTCGT